MGEYEGARSCQIRHQQRHLAYKHQGTVRHRRIAGQSHAVVIGNLNPHGITRSAPGYCSRPRSERQGQVRSAPQHSGQWMGTTEAASGLPVWSVGQGARCLCQLGLQPRWHGPGPPDHAIPIRLCGVQIAIPRGPQCRMDHLGVLRTLCGPRDRGPGTAGSVQSRAWGSCEPCRSCRSAQRRRTGGWPEWYHSVSGSMVPSCLFCTKSS